MPSNMVLEELAREICPFWRSLARQLGMEERRITAYGSESEELTEKDAYRMLLHWKQRYGPQASFQVLYNALSHVLVNRKHLAERFCLFDVKVLRGCIKFIGQERARKTSLKKSLTGIPVDPREDSTVGIEVDPSNLEVENDQVKNWQRTEEKKLDVYEFTDDIAKMIARDSTETTAYQDFPKEQVIVMIN